MATKRLIVKKYEAGGVPCPPGYYKSASGNCVQGVATLSDAPQPTANPNPIRQIGQLPPSGTPPGTTPVNDQGISLPPADPAALANLPPVEPLSDTPVDPIVPSGTEIPGRTVRPVPSLNQNIDRSDPAAAIGAIQPNLRPLPAVQAHDRELKEGANKLMDRLSSLATVSSSFIDMANLADPAHTEIAPSAIAQGVSGAAAGAALGPIGLVGGGLLGVIGGALKAGSQREAFDTEEQNKQKRTLTGLRVAPTIREEGGIVEVESEIDIPIQAEVGELLFLPDGRLVDAMAEDTHKEMKKDKNGKMVTDVIPSGTMILSNSPKKEIDLEDIADHVFTITRGNYSEDGNVPGETITMGDVYGKKGKKTPAAIGKKIRSDFPIIENPIEQIEIDTNYENLRRRAELLRPIMEMQEGVYKKFEYEKPEKFEKGGMAIVKPRKKRTILVKKYEMGTEDCPVGYKKDPDGNCVEDYDVLAKMSEDQQTAILDTIDDPSYRDIVANTIKYKAADMYGDIAPEALTEEEKAKPCAAGMKKLPNGECVYDVAGIAGLPDFDMYNILDVIRDPDEKERITNAVQYQRASNKGAIPPVDKKIGGGAGATIGSAGEVQYLPEFKLPEGLDPNLLKSRAVADRAEVADQAAESEDNAKKLYRAQRFRNMATFAAGLGKFGFQNPVTEAATLGTEHVDSMFPQVTETDIQGQVNPIRRGQARALSTINDSGISGTQVGSAIASTQANLIDAESEIRNKALGVNKTQTAKRFERLQSILDTNNAAQVAATNATRGNRNQLIAGVGDVTGQALKAGGDLKESMATRMEELKKWRMDNKRQIDDNEFKLIVKTEQNRIQKAAEEKKVQMLNDYFENLFPNARRRKKLG